MNSPAPPSETSVLVSLKELVALEDERIQEEEHARAAAQAEAARQRAAEKEAARRAEAARRRQEEEARAEAARREAEDAARREALRLAEVERARVEAEAAAAQAMAETELKHQREIAALTQDHERKRLRRFGFVGLALTLVLGAGATFGAVNHFESLHQQHDQQMQRLSGETRQLQRDRLDALDQLHDRLSRSATALMDHGQTGDELAATRDAVTAARRQVDESKLTNAQLDHFEEALADFSREVARQQRRARYAELEAVRDALNGGLDAMGGDAPKPLREARATAEAARRRVDAYDPDLASLNGYDKALEQLALVAAGLDNEPSRVSTRTGGPTTTKGGEDGKTDTTSLPGCSGHAGDPFCGLDSP